MHVENSTQPDYQLRFVQHKQCVLKIHIDFQNFYQTYLGNERPERHPKYAILHIHDKLTEECYP